MIVAKILNRKGRHFIAPMACSPATRKEGNYKLAL